MQIGATSTVSFAGKIEGGNTKGEERRSENTGRRHNDSKAAASSKSGCSSIEKNSYPQSATAPECVITANQQLEIIEEELHYVQDMHGITCSPDLNPNEDEADSQHDNQSVFGEEASKVSQGVANSDKTFPLNPHKKHFQVDDLVIGKLHGFGWWWGKVIADPKQDEKPPDIGMYMVRWYGDHRTNQVSCKLLEDISMFSKRFEKKKMKKKAMYKEAVKEILEEAAKVCLKTDLPTGNSSRVKFERLKCLIEWASSGFPSSHSGARHNASSKSPGSCLPLEYSEQDPSPVTSSSTSMREVYSKGEYGGGMRLLHVVESSAESTVELSKSWIPNEVTPISQPNDIITNAIQGNVVSTERMPSGIDCKPESEPMPQFTKKASKPRRRLQFGIAIDPSLIGTCPPERRTALKATEAFSVSEKRKSKEKEEESKIKNERIRQDRRSIRKTPEIAKNKNEQEEQGAEMVVEVVEVDNEIIEEQEARNRTRNAIVKNEKISQLQLDGKEGVIHVMFATAENDEIVVKSNDVKEDFKKSKSRCVEKSGSEDKVYGDVATSTNTDPKAKDHLKPIDTCLGRKRRNSARAPELEDEEQIPTKITCKKSSRIIQKEIHKGDEIKCNSTQCTNRESNQVCNKGINKKEVQDKQKKPAVPSKRPVRDFSTSSAVMIKFCTGDLVFGKLAGFNWWPGKIVSYKTARQNPPMPGYCWLYWFGDHKVSLMEMASLESLHAFSYRYLKHRIRGSYTKALEEFLSEAARKCGRNDFLEDEEDPKRLRALIDWAEGGFQPRGADALYRRKNSGDESSGSGNTVSDNLTNDTPAKRCLGVGVNTTPSLNTDVKRLFDLCAVGKQDIEGLCLGCGDTKVFSAHPLFEGGLCKQCREVFMATTHLNDDRQQMYCAICSEGNEILSCDVPGCCRSYCPVCVDMFCGVGYSDHISKQSGNWKCFQCAGERVHLLKSRTDWQERLREMFQAMQQYEDFQPSVYYNTIPYEERKPIRVFALFDGIASGLHVLNELDFQMEIYLAYVVRKEKVEEDQARLGEIIQHVGDVRNIYKKQLDQWGPFDLLIGGSPCNDLSIANSGTSCLFFEYYRIRELLMPNPPESRPFFWLFENVCGMSSGMDKETITRFLQSPPVLVNPKSVSVQNCSHYFWGNLPGMDGLVYPQVTDKLSLKQRLEPSCGRHTLLDQVGCITTRSNSSYQTKDNFLPHELKGKRQQQRQQQKLLGKSWSVSVVRRLLTPLQNYFKTNVEMQTSAVDDIE